MTQLLFEPSGRKRSCPAGETVLEAARRLGVGLRHVCGGQASCTTCRVRVLAGAEFLTPAREAEVRRLPDRRLAEGWRLSCQAQVRGTGEVRVRVPSLVEWLAEREQEGEAEL